MMDGCTIGIDLGGTRIKVALLSSEDTILETLALPTGPDSAADWASRIRDAIHALLDRHSLPLHAVGLAAPGLASPDNRSIWWMEGRLNSLPGADWEALLQLALPVRVINDAHAALIAEARLGAARGARNAALLTLGTGVGGAILCNGALLQGTVGRAGHLGHICLDTAGPRDIVGTPGSLESKIGNCTLADRSGGRFHDTEQLIESMHGGDGEACSLWQESLRYLACGITTIINVIDPELIVIGGGIARAGADLFDPLQEMLREVEWRPHGHRVGLVPAELQDWAGAVGAACFAKVEMDKNR